MSNPWWQRRLLALVLLVSAVLNVYQLQWGLPIAKGVPLGWATDGVAPLAPLVYVKRTLLEGFWYHKYPAFHFMVLSVAYAPYMAYLFLSGQISTSASDTWPYGLSNPVQALSILILLARLVSAAMGTAVVGLVYLITRRLFGGAAAIFAALIVAFSFPVIYYAHTSNVDLPYLFWFTLGLFFYTRLFDADRARDYVLLGACMALAVATKDQAYGLVAAVPLALAWLRVRSREPLPWRRLGLMLAAFAGTYLLAANIVNNWSGYLHHVAYITGPGSIRYQQFPRTVLGQVELLSRTVSLLAWSLNIPLFLVCTAGILWGLARFRGVTAALVAPGLSYFLLFICVISYVYPRFVLPFVVVWAIFGGHLLGLLWSARRRVALVARPAIVILFVYSFLYGASVDWLLQRDPRYEVERWIQKNARPGARLEAFGPPQYQPRLPETLQVRRIELEGYVEDDFRRRMPDYVVLTWAYYRRITDDDQKDFDQEEFLEHLWNGALGYRVSADFKAPELIAPNRIPGLSSRIIILERTREAQAPVDQSRSRTTHLLTKHGPER